MQDAAGSVTGYEVAEQQVDIAGRTWRLETLKDRQQFHDPDGEFEAAGVAPAAWPMFGVVWPAGLLLAEHMAGHPVEGLRILEVGCGLGLASMILHARGADVTASDLHPLAGEFLAGNARRNGLSSPRFRIVDWRRDCCDAAFDLIIGSDLLYERGQAEPLANFIDRHCTADSKVILTDPGRGQVARFNRLMSARGFSVDQTFDGKSRLVRYARSTLSQKASMSTT